MKNKRGQIQQGFQETPKKSNLWLGVIIILILFSLGIGIYFWLSGDRSSIIGGGNSIPQPPAFPN